MPHDKTKQNNANKISNEHRPGIPPILCGPILRRTQTDSINLWLVCSELIPLTVTLSHERGEERIEWDALKASSKVFSASPLCHIYLLTVCPTSSLPLDTWIHYDILINSKNSEKVQGIAQWNPELCYSGTKSPRFVIHSETRHLFHGSCRKPHHGSKDGLAQVDHYLQEHGDNIEKNPAALILSGDQIYTDDVAGPMLMTIHRLVRLLQFPSEVLPSEALSDSHALHGGAQANYYRRNELLPKTGGQEHLYNVLFGGAKKPVFTSINANNHLISLAEMLCMYLLVWSPTCWRLVTPPSNDKLENAKHKKRFAKEQEHLNCFVEQLPAVSRVLANVATAMIFDDHDISDDWNLTAGWEQAAYNHAFSRRIIGNALIAYLLCQGYSNAPEHFPEPLMESVNKLLENPGTSIHNSSIDQLLRFSSWHYTWDLKPKLVVLDTRTRRWRSEVDIHKPSGLMDWEAFSELKETLHEEKAVCLVSPAPMFGVKLIEIIQRVFTWFGKPLMVDAENWMAHPGAASSLINLFCDPHTPRTFIVLSGDVHYSFVYKVHLRGEKSSPNIWQITSSGIRNEFPKFILEILDRANRWLFAPWSPLNWLTKRRRMLIVPHVPENAASGERLLNESGIGLVSIDSKGAPSSIAELSSSGEHIEFLPRNEARRWE